MDIAVIGLGAMGSRIAQRLIGAGHHLVVWNRTAERAMPLVAAGAVLAASPAEAAAAVDYVITMVADPAALTAVVTADDGLLRGLRPGHTVLEMSTVGPSAIAELRALLPEGVELLDTPVLGSLSEVESGTLSVYVGGSDGAVAAVRPMLDVLGTVLHVGPLGAGAAAKLVANATLMGSLALLGEVLALGRGLGLDQDRVFDVLAATPLAGQAARRRPAVEATEEMPRRFRLVLGLKDCSLVVDEARRAGLQPPLLSATEAWFADAVGAGLAERDYSAILRHIMERPAGD
ncbi:MAG: 3-hydroxyisobutyrate dehydrogenase [Acidimicrobiia bacterium]|nr:3-hydroxyisobutyrate dehydrogenase [Acidimicrobiia bacterium]